MRGITFQRVGDFERGPILIVRVPHAAGLARTWSRQINRRFGHAIAPAERRSTCARSGAAFLAGTEMTTRVRRFRDERLGRIISGETPTSVSLETHSLRSSCMSFRYPISRSHSISTVSMTIRLFAPSRADDQ